MIMIKKGIAVGNFLGLVVGVCVLAGCGLGQETHCSKINLGTHHFYNNVVSYGQVMAGWKLGEHHKSGVIREHRETEHFYLKYPNKVKVDPYQLVRLKTSNSQLAGAIFKIEEDELYKRSEHQSSWLISIIYTCNPVMKTNIELELKVSVPSCDMLEVKWSKICGNSLAPIPGLNASITSGNFKNVQVISDGIFDIQDPKLEGFTKRDADSFVGHSIALGVPSIEINFWLSPHVSDDLAQLGFINMLESNHGEMNILTREQAEQNMYNREFETPKFIFDESVTFYDAKGDMQWGGAVTRNSGVNKFIVVKPNRKH
jgi:hypothetical protein